MTNSTNPPNWNDSNFYAWVEKQNFSPSKYELTPKYQFIDKYSLSWSTSKHAVSRKWVLQTTLGKYGYQKFLEEFPKEALSKEIIPAFNKRAFKALYEYEKEVIPAERDIIFVDHLPEYCGEKSKNCLLLKHRFERTELERYTNNYIEKLSTTLKNKGVETATATEVAPVTPLPSVLDLTFEQREILINALHREQHVINEGLRLALLDNSAERSGILLGRQRALLELMTKLDISPDSYDNTKVWLMGLDYSVPNVGQLPAFYTGDENAM